MRYHYGSPYEGEPDSPYHVKPDSPQASEEPDSPEAIEESNPREATEEPDSPQAVPQATPPPAGAKPSRWRLLLAGGSLLVIVAIVLGFLVHAASAGSTTRQAAATATSVPRVLYSADWSHGTAGWTLPTHWSLVKGHIQNDGYGRASLLIPYEVTQPNYTIRVGFTVQSVPPYKACHSYGILGVSSGNNQQFVSSIACLTKLAVAYHGFSQNFVDHADSQSAQMSTNDYTLEFFPQIFTVQVQENHDVDFCPGVSCLANVNSTTPLSPLQIGIYDIGVRLTVNSIVITSP